MTPTLKDALDSQSDLAWLCADRLPPTGENFGGNTHYGMAAILKQYAELPTGYRVNAVIPHGVVWDGVSIWDAEAAAMPATVFCYPAYRKEVYQRAGKEVTLSASPFLYVVEMLKNGRPPDRSGTIFFPAHSTHHITAQVDWEGTADELVRLGEEYQPVTVCIYWRDFNLGHHAAFQERGLRIVSAGHLYDPLFLFRLYHLCSMHRYSAGSEMGSHIFYSIESGCSYIAHPSELIFGSPACITAAGQMQVADEYLGADYLKSRHELRKQILNAEAQ